MEDNEDTMTEMVRSSEKVVVTLRESKNLISLKDNEITKLNDYIKNESKTQMNILKSIQQGYEDKIFKLEEHIQNIKIVYDQNIEY
mmetsp:Transcript_28212/g.24927  ORF Transcript_28212/g.24927 Transcript_28212/m.24927 type:complete len:86 (+) Transcript_28212:355-612(+)